VGWKALKPLASGDFLEAAEGTRTLDLLHGKQTLIARSQPFVPAYRHNGAFDASLSCLGFRRFSSGFWHPIGTRDAGRADVATVGVAVALHGSDGGLRAPGRASAAMGVSH
jgi:hypothetical protein